MLEAHNLDYDTDFDAFSTTVFVWSFDRKHRIERVSDRYGSTCGIPNAFGWYLSKDTNHTWSIFRPHASFCALSRCTDPERIFRTFYNVRLSPKYAIFARVTSNPFSFHKWLDTIHIERQVCLQYVSTCELLNCCFEWSGHDKYRIRKVFRRCGSACAFSAWMYPDLRMYNEDIDMDVHLKIHHKIEINKLLKKRAENWNIGRRFQIRWAIRKKKLKIEQNWKNLFVGKIRKNCTK